MIATDDVRDGAMQHDDERLPAERDRKIRQSFASQGMMTTLGADITVLGPGRCRIVAPVAAATGQQHGFAHAGLTFAIGDSAAGYAALTLMGDADEVVTSEMTIHLLAPARGTRLVAEGRVVRPGRRLMVVQADVHAEDGDDRRHVAILTGTMVPVAARPPE